MALNAGSVFVRLGAQIERRGFEQFDREIAQARRQDVQARLAGKFDDRAFQQMERAQARLKRDKEIRTQLKGVYDPRAINSYVRDIDRAERADNDMIRSQGRLRTAFGSVYGRGGALFAAAGGLYGLQGAFRAVVGAASDVNESLTRNRVLFGDNAREVERFAETTAGSFGISRKSALDYAGTLGNLLRTTGLARDESAKFSTRLIRLAADMASFNNADPTEVLEAMRSGLVGEAEPMRRFGVLLSETRVKQEAVNEGIAKSGEELTEAQKVQARYSLILRDSTKAQGDFERTSGGMANQQRILKARISDIAVTMGQRLLPVALDVVQAVNRFVKQMQNGTGAGGRFVEIVKDIGEALKDTGEFIRDHIDLVKLAVSTWVAYKAAVIAASIAGRFRGRGAPVAPTVAAGGAAGSAAASAGAGAAGGAASRLAPSLAAVGGVAGGVAAFKIGTDFLKGYADAGSAVKLFEDRIKSLASSGNRAGLRKLADEIRAYGNQNQDAFNDSGKAVRKFADDVEKLADEGKQSSGRLSQVTSEIQRRFRAMRDFTKGDLDDIRKTVRENMADIRRRLGNETKEGRQAASENFRGARNAIRAAMRSGVIDVKQGTREIRDLLTNELRFYGVNARDARRAAGQGGTRDDTFRLAGRAQGGWIGVRGMVGADTVPAMLAPGEFVLNRHQQAVVEGILGQGFLDRLASVVNRPHYAAHGGRVEHFAAGGRPSGRVRRVDVGGDGAIGRLSQAAVDLARAAAQTKLGRERPPMSPGRGGAGDVQGLVPQVLRALAWARRNGWAGSVTSGFRSYQEQARLYALWLSGRGNRAAPPGTSNHEGGQAVDVSDPEGFARAMANAPAGIRLLRLIADEPWHFSVTGRARGGRVGFSKGGRAELGRQNRVRVRAYDELIDEVEGLRRREGIETRRFDQTEEVFVNPDTGELDPAAIDQRSGELDELIGLREKIAKKLERARKMADRVAKTFDTIVERLKNAVGAAKGDRKNKLREELRQAYGDRKEWTRTARDAGFDVQDARLDVTDLVNEKAAVTGTRPAPVDPGVTGDAGDTGAGDAPASPAQIAEQVLAQLASYRQGQADLFSSFASNFVSAQVNPFTTQLGRDAAFRFYGAAGPGAGQPLAPGAAASVPAAAPARDKVEINQYFEYQPPALSWSQDIKHELQAAL